MLLKMILAATLYSSAVYPQTDTLRCVYKGGFYQVTVDFLYTASRTCPEKVDENYLPTSIELVR